MQCEWSFVTRGFFPSFFFRAPLSHHPKPQPPPLLHICACPIVLHGTQVLAYHTTRWCGAEYCIQTNRLSVGSNILIADDLVGKPKGIKRILQDESYGKRGWRSSAVKQRKKSKRLSNTIKPVWRLTDAKKERDAVLENELGFLNENPLLEIEITRYVVFKLFQVQVKIIPAYIPLANEP